MTTDRNMLTIFEIMKLFLIFRYNHGTSDVLFLKSPCLLELLIEIFMPQMIRCQDSLLSGIGRQEVGEGTDEARLTLSW